MPVSAPRSSFRPAIPRHSLSHSILTSYSRSLSDWRRASRTLRRRSSLTQDAEQPLAPLVEDLLVHPLAKRAKPGSVPLSLPPPLPSPRTRDSQLPVPQRRQRALERFALLRL